MDCVLQVVCGYEHDSMGSTVGEDARVIQCLQDYRRAGVGSPNKTQQRTVALALPRSIKHGRKPDWLVKEPPFVATSPSESMCRAA